MIDLLKLTGAVLAIYFGLLGIRGTNNVDADGKLTTAGKRTVAVFLICSMLGVLAIVGESVEKTREASTATRRYEKGLALDSVNLSRSEALLDRSTILVGNLRRLDSLAQLQLVERGETLKQQRALNEGQSALLRHTARVLYPLETPRSFISTLVIDSDAPGVQHYLDSLQAVAMDRVPVILAELPELPEDGRQLRRTVGEVIVTYRIDREAPDRMRPVGFEVNVSNIWNDDVQAQLWVEPTLGFYCCGFPNDGERPIFGLLSEHAARGRIASGDWGTGTISITVPMLGRAGEHLPLGMRDLTRSTAVLDINSSTEIWTIGPQPDLSHIRVASVSVEFADGREIRLAGERWLPAPRREYYKCTCFIAEIVERDVEIYPGELVGAPTQPIFYSP